MSERDEEEGMTEKEKCPRKYITVETEEKKNTKKSSGQIWDQKKSPSYVK